MGVGFGFLVTVLLSFPSSLCLVQGVQVTSHSFHVISRYHAIISMLYHCPPLVHSWTDSRRTTASRDTCIKPERVGAKAFERALSKPTPKVRDRGTSQRNQDRRTMENACEGTTSTFSAFRHTRAKSSNYFLFSESISIESGRGVGVALGGRNAGSWNGISDE